MTRRLAARLARIEVAMGVDPVQAEQQQRDVDAETRVRAEIAESIFSAELLADCATRSLTSAFGGRKARGCTALPVVAVECLLDLQRITGERGAAWSRRVDRLLSDAARMPPISGELGARTLQLLDRCVAELRALDLDQLESLAR